MSHGWLDRGSIAAPPVDLLKDQNLHITDVLSHRLLHNWPDLRRQSRGRHAVSFSLAELTSHRWFKFTALLGNLWSNLSHWRLPLTKTHYLRYSANNCTHTHRGCGMCSMSPDLIHVHVWRRLKRFAVTTKASLFRNAASSHPHTQTNAQTQIHAGVLCSFVSDGAGCVFFGGGCFVPPVCVHSQVVMFCVFLLCALTGHSAGSTWGPVCSSRCPWSDTVPNHPPPLWQKGLAVLEAQQQQDCVK